MDKLQTQSETKTNLERNNIVSYNGKPCVVLGVDKENGCVWIQNTMDIGSRKQDPMKVKIEDIDSEGGYGDTLSKEERMPMVSSVIFEDRRVVSMLPKADRQEVEEATDGLVGKTWREVGELQLPSA